MHAEHSQRLGWQRDAHFATGKFRGAIAKHGLQLVGSFQRRVLDGDFERGRLWGVVVDHQQLLFRQLAHESIVGVVPSDVPLLSGAQRGVALAQRQQRLRVSEYILLFGGAAARRKGVVRIAREASRKVAPVVGVFAARHRDFFARINLRDPAQSRPGVAGGLHRRANLVSWTTRDNPEAKRFAGTARYTIAFDHPAGQADDWVLELGRVCEAARVKLNGHDVGAVWCAPWQINVGQFLKSGKNVLEIEVTNLAANRVRDLDIRQVNWKYFYDANMNSKGSGRFDASRWPLRDSGLLGPVRLQAVKKIAVL